MYRCSSHDGTFEAVILCTYGNGHIGTAAQRYEALQSPPVFERSGDGDDSASEGSSISVRSVIADVKPKMEAFRWPISRASEDNRLHSRKTGPHNPQLRTSLSELVAAMQSIC